MSNPESKPTPADIARRQEAERLAKELDIHADIVLSHLLELERQGIIQLREDIT